MKLFNFLLKLLFFFVFIFSSSILLKTIYRIGFKVNNIYYPYLLLGFFGALAFFIIVKEGRMQNLYVFGHEMTHWIVAKLMLKETGGLGSIKVSASGGCVMIHNPNFVITLAPYFVPFYTLLTALIYFIIQFFLLTNHQAQCVHEIFFFIFGVTYAYHIVMNIIAISYGQKDLHQVGVFFSLSFILFCNLFFLFLTQYIVNRFPLNNWKILREETISLFQWIYSLIG